MAEKMPQLPNSPEWYGHVEFDREYDPPLRYLRIGENGNVSVTTWDNRVVVYNEVMPAERIIGVVRKINSEGTTIDAVNIIGYL